MRSSPRVRFQHIPIDLTRLGTQKDSDNCSFLSILRSSTGEEYSPLHGAEPPRVIKVMAQILLCRLWYVLARREEIRV